MKVDIITKNRKFRRFFSVRRILPFFIFLFIVELADAQYKYVNKNLAQVKYGVNRCPNFINQYSAGMIAMNVNRITISNNSYNKINPVSGNQYYSINQWSLSGLNAAKYFLFGSRLHNTQVFSNADYTLAGGFMPTLIAFQNKHFTQKIFRQ